MVKVHFNCKTHSANPKPMFNIPLWNALIQIMIEDLEKKEENSTIFETSVGLLDNSYE